MYGETLNQQGRTHYAAVTALVACRLKLQMQEKIDSEPIDTFVCLFFMAGRCLGHSMQGVESV